MSDGREVERKKIEVRGLSKEFESIVRQSSQVYIIVHKHADVDAIASSCHLCNLVTSLTDATTNCSILVPEGLSSTASTIYDMVAGKVLCPIVIARDRDHVEHLLNQHAGDSESLQEEGKRVSLVVVDTASLSHLSHLGKVLVSKGIDMLIDHHAHNSLTKYSKHYLVDDSFYSSSEIVALLSKELGVEVEEKLYCMLQLGIITDTSRFSRAGPLTFEAMAYLSGYCDYNTATDMMPRSRRSRSEIIALLKALQRLQLHTNRFIVAGTFVGSEESAVLSMLLQLGVDAGFVANPGKDNTRITYRVRDGAPEELTVLLHKAIARALGQLAEGPLGHNRAGVYLIKRRLAKRDMPSLVKRILDSLEKYLAEHEGRVG